MRQTVTLLVLSLLIGCRHATQTAGGPAMKMTSTAFQEGGNIPQQHTADGKDVSPALKWEGAPPQTKTFALICDDPDAPRGTWLHWVIFNIPADQTELTEAVERSAKLARDRKSVV